MIQINKGYAIGPLTCADDVIKAAALLRECKERIEKVLTAKNVALHFEKYPKSVLYFVYTFTGWNLNNHDCLPGTCVRKSLAVVKKELNL